ncbi:GEVED domain-containing protein [Photobacterium leiognathi]|uniref:GEVED domain-containing protein n=1 Tax=Photobacterium leiognathi TaxID=553611 RepID=UPI002980E929|nr:GEVED domain-containing protein [Photobacterium leiognathi]
MKNIPSRLVFVFLFCIFFQCGNVFAVPIYWTDWQSGSAGAGTASGQIITAGSTVTVTYSQPAGYSFIQTSSGADYWVNQGGARDPATSPFTSAFVDNIPTPIDIIALAYQGTNTLTFSEPIANPVFCFVSLNGNGYSFDRDFEILSQTGSGNACGYWGCGNVVKQVFGSAYQLNATSGEPHGCIRFTEEAAFSTVSWTSQSNETWNGFTLGIEGTEAEVFAERDYGDAPDTSAGTSNGDYQTLESNGGANHAFVDTDEDTQVDITLGTLWDGSDSGNDGALQNAAATSDDLDNIDDEDGVSWTDNFIRGGNANISVTITKDPDSTLAGLRLYAWVDWNQDGDWNDASEQIISNTSANSSTQSYPVSIPPTATLGSTYLRVRVCSDADCNSPNGDADDGEVEDYLLTVIAPQISGFVFNDNGSGGGTATNGIKDGGESGLGFAVPVVAYNAATGMCYAANADPTTGAYTISAGVVGTYQVYEAINETNIASPTCPPTQPTLNTATGAYSGGTIGDPTNFHSSSANVVSVTAGVTSNVNFGDFAITPFDTCSSDAYLLRNSPTDITGVSLATGAITPLFNNVLPSSTGVFGGTGYNVITNTLFGDNTNNNNTVLMIDGGGNAFVLPITGSTMALSNYNSGDIDDDGNLLLMTSSGTSLYKIDVNPNSATYLQQVQQLSVSAPVMADMAINPIDNMLYTLTPSGSLVRFDPANGARTNLGSVGTAGTTAVGWGAVYFDDQGFMYASQNPNPGRIIRIDISNPTLPSGSYVAVNYTQMNASTSQNDGARCRFANLPLDFADAPTANGYATELADNGPRHLIESNLPYLGANEPDSENDAQPNATANGDDTNGLTPDDEDGFIQPSITTILAGGDNVAVSVPVVTSGNDNLYGWIDFDLSGTFDNDERATVAVNASGNSTLNFTVPADVKIQDTFVRLRICSSGETCSSPTGSTGDGEVEDHQISLKPPGDLELDLELEPGVNVTLGIPFNVVVKVENKGTTIALNTKVTLPIPAGYSFVRAYEGDGVTPTTIYDSATGELDLGAVGLGFNDYAVIRLAPQSSSAPPISGEIIETSINDTDSTPNNGFNNGEDDTDTVTPNITNVVQPNICESPVVYEGGDAYLDANGEYVVTTNTPNQAGYLWSLQYIDLNQPMYAELAVYLGDRSANTGGPAGEAGADGMTFVLSADPRDLNAVGDFGGGLGVGDNFGGQRVQPSIVFEFDTFDNTFIGATDDALGGQYIDHTGVYLNGDIYTPDPANTLIPATSVAGGELEDGRYHIAQFYWDPTTNQFTYYMDGVMVGQFTRNIRNDIGNNMVRFGFTGSTGDSFNLQKGCFTDAPDVLDSDFGDAVDTTAGTGINDYTTIYNNDGAHHVQVDTDDNGFIDLRLGNLWDADVGNLQDILARADDNTNFDDEDGVTVLALATIGENLSVTVNVVEDAARTSTGQRIYGWMDFNLDGDWDDAGEQVISQTNAAIGINNFTVPIPAGAVAGHTYLRVRLCSNVDCNSPIGRANDGEVEDYRILVSDLVGNNQCDLIMQTIRPVASSDYTYTSLDVPSNPITFSDITNPIAITNQSNIANINAIGFNRVNGLIYGTFTDMSHADRTHHLFVTDKTGTSFIDLGEIRAAAPSTIRRLQDGDTFSFAVGDSLRNTGYTSTAGPTVTLSAPIAGDVTSDGSELIIWRTSWDSIVKVDLETQTFTTVLIDIAALGGSYGGGSINVGADLAINSVTGVGYILDLDGDSLYTINLSTGAVTTDSLSYFGAEPTVDSSGKLQAGALVMDNGISLYAITNGGNHDTDANNAIDLNDRAVVYRVNVVTGDVEYVTASDQGSLQGNDGAGCYDSTDYGDALASYGEAGHQYFDSATDGTADLFLGSRWDPEFGQWITANASGDDTNGQDDEDLSIPGQIIVETFTNLPIQVVGTGYVNIWVDLNNDGDFDDPNEFLIDDEFVTTGLNNIPVLLDANSAEGFNGYTVMRVRLCSTSNTCDSVSGLVADGEVEDHWFELLNRIVLNGLVFEDNGVGGATAAHDGIQDGSEVGLGNFTVTVTFNDTGVAGYATGDVIATEVTSGGGTYQFIIGVDFSGKNLLLDVVKKADWIDISEANVTAIPQVTSVSVIDSQMAVNANAGDEIFGLDFGKVREPRMEPDNFSEATPGSVVFFPHKFTAATSGNVNFNIINPSTSPTNTAWSTVLYHDVDCDGTLNGVEAQVVNPVAVNGNSTICLLSKITVPANATLNAHYHYDIEANMTFADTTGTGHGITRQVLDKDTVRAIFSGSGELRLEKTVRNVTQNGPVTTSNQGKPGDVVEYVVTFTNMGSDVLTDVKIFDSTPEFTELSQTVQCNDGIVPGLLVCNVVTSDGTNSPGYQGSISWEMTGSLAAGESGTVVYRVLIK